MNMLAELREGLPVSDRGLAGAVAFAAVVSLGMSSGAVAAPEGGEIVGGSGSISKDGDTTTVNQESSNLVVDWDSFNVGTNERVHFEQATSSHSALNRIYDASPSEIWGSITARGKVWLLNPNGVIFSRTARVSTGSLVAAGLWMESSDFMAGRYVLNGARGVGSVVNMGQVDAATGMVAMAGSRVVNSGTIRATASSVLMASGSRVAMVGFGSDGLMRFAVQEHILNPYIENDGIIGGKVIQMDARGANGVLDGVINTGGVLTAYAGNRHENAAVDLRADDIRHTGEIYAQPQLGADGRTHGGDVYLHANDELNVAGPVDARGDHGGSVELLGDSVTITSTVDVSGVDSGGEIAIGRTGYPGTTSIDLAEGAVLRANANTAGGDGAGTIRADAMTIKYAGHIEAKNPHQSGVGGSASLVAADGFHMNGGTSDLSGGSASGALAIHTESVSICSGQDDACSGKNKFKDVDVAAVLAKNDLLIASVNEWRRAYVRHKGDVDVDRQAQVSWDSDSKLSLHADRDMDVSGSFEADSGSLELQVRYELKLPRGADSVRDVDTVQLAGEYQGYYNYPELHGPERATVWDIGADSITMDGFTMGLSNIGTFVAGDMADTFTIGESVGFFIQGRGGNDRFTIDGMTEDLVVWGGRGEDTFTVNGGISGFSALSGGSDSDLYVLNGVMSNGACFVDNALSNDVYRLGGTIDGGIVFDAARHDEYTLTGTITNKSEIRDYSGNDSYSMSSSSVIEGGSVLTDRRSGDDSYSIAGSVRGGSTLKDAGGDDTYDITETGSVDGSEIINWGSGDDSYSIAGRFGGGSLLEDFGGSDAYTIDGAVSGRSLVSDRRIGDDTYAIAGSISGGSLLEDYGGHDSYTVSGSIGGGAGLDDFGGDDTYVISGAVSGASKILDRRSGDDSYTVSGSISGGSMLKDLGGSDSYAISGIVEGRSTVMDKRSGDDSYTISGSIRGSSLLEDFGGDDSYTVAATGSIEGHALVKDRGGSDTYSVHGSMGQCAVISDLVGSDSDVNGFSLYGSMDGGSFVYLGAGSEASVEVGADAVVSDSSVILSWAVDSSFVIDGTVTDEAALAAFSFRDDGSASFELNGTLSDDAALIAFARHGDSSFVVNGIIDDASMVSGLGAGRFVINEGGVVQEGSEIKSYLGSYDDVFVMNGAFNGGTVSLGGGQDSFTIGGTVSGGEMYGGSGADAFTINGAVTGGRLQGGSGDDSYTISGSVRGSSELKDSGGDDTYTVTATGSIEGNALLEDASGDDTYLVHGSIGGYAQIKDSPNSDASGSDVDSFRLYGSMRGSSTVIFGGGGESNVRVETGAALRRYSDITSSRTRANFIIDGSVLDNSTLAAWPGVGGGRPHAGSESYFEVNGTLTGGLLSEQASNSFVVNGLVDGGRMRVRKGASSFVINDGAEVRGSNAWFAADPGNYDDTFVMNGVFSDGRVGLGGGQDSFTMGATGTFSSGWLYGGDGADSITFITGSRLQGGVIDSGAGDDDLVLNSNISGGRVETGADDDSLVIHGIVTGGDIGTGAGHDTIEINHAYFAVILEAGAGNDVITIGEPGTIAGGAIRGNDGNDEFRLVGGVSGTGVLAGGAGADSFIISGLVSGHGSVYGGAGDDTFTIAPGGQVTSSGSLNGGRSGNDVLSFGGLSNGVDVTVDGVTMGPDGNMRGFSGSATNVVEFNGMDSIIGGMSSEDSAALPSGGYIDSRGQGSYIYRDQEEGNILELSNIESARTQN